MKLTSGATKKSRQKRALELSNQQLKNLMQIKQEKGDDFIIITKRQSIPVKKKIAQKQKLIQHQEAAITNNSKFV